MDWLDLKARYSVDADLPARAAVIGARMKVLAGTLYDALPYPFSTERAPNGDYVPLRDRRPSVRTGICRVVVDDAVSLLFSEGHFPQIDAAAEATKDALALLVKTRHLNAVLVDAATRGSVGSVCILLRILNRKPFFSVLDTPYLTPTWAADDPDKLVSVAERYKVTGRDLVAQGYDVDSPHKDYWFARTWDSTAETWFVPQLVGDKDAKPQVDTTRTVAHGLGFVPMVWVRNLPGGDEIDGACTFEPAVDTVIEADYQLSQAGRGLKYASDPTLVIVNPAMGMDEGGQRVGGAAQSMTLPPEGDAKLLEINGTAAAAVREHVEALRQVALETMHGNRTSSDKLSAASSGRAMELMSQGLIWLADRLRISYGEGALLSLMRMVCAASARVTGGIWIGGDADGGFVSDLSPKQLSLKWPAWFQPTHDDARAAVEAANAARNGGIISRETALRAVAPIYDVEDIDAELAMIAADEAAADARAAAAAAAVNVAETIPE